MLTGTLQPPLPKIVPPETWQMATPQGMEEQQPITAKQCAAMIQEALQHRDAPAMGASFGALSGTISPTNNRVEVLAAEVRSSKLRTAWTERDILSSQMQVKRKIVCRNFPEWLTIGDIKLTVRHALTEAGLHMEGGHSFGSSPHRGWSEMMARSFSQLSPSSPCPTWLSGRRLCRPAVEFVLDMQKCRKSLSQRTSSRTHGKTGFQLPSQAKRRRVQSKAIRLAHRHQQPHLGHFHSPQRRSHSL